MKSKKELILGVIAGVTLATAGSLLAGTITVPNQFRSGAPARAAEVNQNFNTLADGHNEQEGRIAALETSNGAAALTPLTISSLDAEPGSAITVGGRNYHICAAPVVRNDTGETYHVQFPCLGGGPMGNSIAIDAIESSGGQAPLVLPVVGYADGSQSGNPVLLPGAAPGFQATIDGFSVKVGKTIYGTLHKNEASNDLVTSYRGVVSLVIQLGAEKSFSTHIKLGSVSNRYSPPPSPGSGAGDYRAADTKYPGQATRDLMRTEMDELLRYVRIKKQAS